MLTQLDILRQDLLFAVRQLWRTPGFAAVAVGSLAIGIGANVTVYTVARAFVRRPPDAARPSELVRIYRGRHSPLARDSYLHFARHSRTLAAVIAEDPMPVGLERQGVAERVFASVVSENFFQSLGVHAALGSVFQGKPGDPVGSVAVLTHAYWRAKLGGDSTVVGSTIRLNNNPFIVVGVAREGFKSSQFSWGPNLFVPLSEQGRLRGGRPEVLGQTSLYVTGRLAEGRTPAQVEAELLALAATLPDAPPEASRPGAFHVERARGITAEVRGAASVVSAFLMVVVGAVLLIACANLANLLLARGTGRRKEIAIRTALGVSRGRLVRQLLTESVFVATIGGVAGLGLAWYVTELLPRLLPETPELVFELAPDLNVLAFTGAVAIVTGVLFGLAPALQASRWDALGSLRAEAVGAGARRSRARSAFLTSQVSLATVLLVIAALFLRSLQEAQHVDLGFRSDRVADLPIDLSLRQYEGARARLFYEEALERVRELPQVEATTLIRFVPLTGSSMGRPVAPASSDPSDRAAWRGTTFTAVAAGYFEMFGIPLVRGRAFDAGDREDSPPVAVVNESFARMLWPDGDPVGQRVHFDDGATVTVIGVARDTKYVSLGERDRAFLYLPASQSPQAAMVLQARLRHDTPAERAAVREAVQRLDPALPLPEMTSMDDDMEIALLPARAGASVLGAFGALALLLATLGVYGVTSYLVGQRTSEIGIRTALGATRRDVLQLVMRDTLVLVLLGLGLGLAGGIGLGAVASRWLYGVGALDPAPLASACLVLLTVALLGTWLPARRAIKVDPLEALRHE